MNTTELDYLKTLLARCFEAMKARPRGRRADMGPTEVDQIDLQDGRGLPLPASGVGPTDRKRDQRVRDALQAAGLVVLLPSPYSAGASHRVGRVMLTRTGANAAAAAMGVAIPKSLKELIAQYQPPADDAHILGMLRDLRGDRQ